MKTRLVLLLVLFVGSTAHADSKREAFENYDPELMALAHIVMRCDRQHADSLQVFSCIEEQESAQAEALRLQPNIAAEDANRCLYRYFNPKVGFDWTMVRSCFRSVY